MIGSDGLDDYDGEYDDEATRVDRAASEAITSAVAAPERHEHRERPWWCAHCHAPPQTDSDRLYGVCGGCAARDRAQRERARANSEVSMGGPAQRSGRRAA